MKIVEAVVQEGILVPTEPLPLNAKAIVYDGEKYVIYEEGDEVPSST